MASDPKAPEVMEWQQGEQGKGEGGAKRSRTSAPSVETTVTHLARTHSADRMPQSPVAMCFPAKFKGTPGDGKRTPEPTSESVISVRIPKLEQILGQLDPKLTEGQDRQHLAFNSLPTDILLMAQELLKVKIQLKSGVQLVSRELARIDEQVQQLDVAYQKVHESFATQVAERLGETDQRQTRHEAVNSHLH